MIFKINLDNCIQNCWICSRTFISSIAIYEPFWLYYKQIIEDL